MEKLIKIILKELKEKISERYNINEMRIFGSSARGDRRIDSDIDVFIHLTKVNSKIEEELYDMAYDLELKYDCLIDLIVFSDDSIKSLSSSPIYQKIMEEGSVI